MVKNDCGIMVEVKKYKKGVEGSKLSRSRKDVNTARKVSDHRALFRRLTLAGKPKMPGPSRACFNDPERFTIGSCCTSHLLGEAWFIQPLCTMLEHQTPHAGGQAKNARSQPGLLQRPRKVHNRQLLHKSSAQRGLVYPTTVHHAGTGTRLAQRDDWVLVHAAPKVATLDFDIRVLPRRNSSLTQATAAQRRSQRTRDMDWAAPQPARLRNKEAPGDGAAFAKTRKPQMAAER